MSKIRGELRQLSPARRLLGLLPVLVVALAVAAALGGVGVASADEPEAAALAADAGSAAEPAAEAEPESEPAADPAATDPAPAQTLTATLPDGTTVKVEAPAGALPQGTTLEAKAVQNDAVTQAVTDAAKADGTELTSVKAIDVTLRDAAGRELEPGAAVKVTFSNTGMGSDDVSVYHVTAADGDEANASTADELTVKPVATQKAEADEQVFTTDHFSVYAVGTDTNRLIVRFHQWNGSNGFIDTTVDYKIKNDDDLTKSVPDPGAGNLGTNQVFRGWVTSETYDENTALLTIEDVRKALEGQLPPAADGTTVDYYPAVFNAYTVTYQDQEGKITLAQDTVFGVPGQNVSYKVKEISYDPASQNQCFDGWVDEAANKTYKSGDTIANLTSNVTLKASVSNGYWITYNSNGAGASHVAPVFYTATDTPTAPEAPTRAGHTFGGWYTTANPSDTDQPFFDANGNGQKPSPIANVTLYAKWTPVESAEYTIVFWQQSVSDSKDAADKDKTYDYESSAEGNGVPGTTVTADTQDVKDAIAKLASTKYTGFKLNRVEPAEIKADGSTVVNVYYDRDLHTLTFKTDETQIWNAVNVYAAGVTASENYWGDLELSYNNHTLQKVNGQWGYYTGFLSQTWHPVTVYVDGVTENSDDTLTYNGQVLQRNGSEWGYYTDNPDATTTITALYGQPIYDRFTESPLKDYGWTKNPNENPVTILGFLNTMPAEDAKYYSVSEHGSKTYYMNYYLENLPDVTGTSYSYDGAQKQFTLKLKTTTKSNGLTSTKDEDFIPFEGFTQWTSNPEYRSDGNADFAAMSDDYNNTKYKIDFYYARKQYDVVYQDGLFVDANGTEQNETSQGILHTETGVYYGQSLSGYGENYTPTHKGYVFEGWYTDPTCTSLATDSVFKSGSTMPAHNVTVYAKWVKVQYEVEFYPNVDSLPDSANTIVNNGETVEAPKNFEQSRPGYELVGWYTDDTCTKPFNFDSAISADTASALNMTVPYTNEKYPYVQGKLNLYAKWRKVLAEAKGVTVVYDAAKGTINNDGTYTDPALYQTDADVIATGAAKPTDTTKNFQYWVLQTWNADANNGQGAFEDTSTHVYPGSSFNVASVTAHEFTGSDNKAQAVVQLRAEYGDKLPMTTVVFDPNGGNFSGSTAAWSQDYSINDDIALPGDGGSGVPVEPERDGYEFVGWATTAPAADATDEAIQAAVKIQPKKNRTQNYRADNLIGIAKSELEGTTNTLHACWKPKYVTLTIQKELVGAQADLTKGYVIQVTGTDGSIKGLTASTNALHDYSGEQGVGDTDVVDSVSNGSTTIKLKRGDKVTITETTEHAGYDMTYKVTNGTRNDDGSITLNPTGQVVDGKTVYNTTVVVTNTKTDTVVTGIKSAGVPGALTAVGAAALAIAGGFAYVRRDETGAGAHSRRRGRR